MSELKGEKRRLIKDPVWGNLDIFSWESHLLNHFLFNRLHNIVQNSSAYKVYPGLKYSRFLHSVGVSHVATQMFFNVSAKVEGEARDALTAEAAKIAEYVPASSRKAISHAITKSFPCCENDALMLAGIRIAALVHDIGHLPYSHVFENAMEGFLKAELGSAIKVTSAALERKNELNALLASEEGSDAKLHEILGRKFIQVLLATFRENLGLSGLLKVAAKIVETTEMPIAKGIIAGTIDADRIDFVRRDGFFSGLFNSSVDFGRLFAFYELAPKETDKKKGIVWRPRPSTRAVSETEKLLMERFLDYKYIVVHHKVHLYDEIMENILVRLMATGKLNGFLSTLCTLLKPQKPQNDNHIHAQEQFLELLKKLMTEFDDPWMEVEIRNQYKNLRTSGNPTTKLLFEAYVEDRGCFRSAFKTDDDFKELCGKYAPDLLTADTVQIRNGFGASKYVLQDELSNALGRTVLIGATDKKLSFGIRNDGAAEFVNIPDLYRYLVDKKIRSLTFNFWYEEQGQGGTHEEVVAKALGVLQEKIVKQLQLIDPKLLAAS